MNKIFIMIITSLMVLTACTSDEEDYSRADEKKLISFARPVMYGVTRNVFGEIEGKYPEGENFMIYGKKYEKTAGYQGWNGATDVFSAGDELMSFKDAVSLKGWFPQKAYYFQKDYKYAFGGYSPADVTTNTVAGGAKAASAAYDDTGLKITDYYAGILGRQVDLMYAPRIYDITSQYDMNHSTQPGGMDGNINKYYDGVNIPFCHALSSIHFKVCVDPNFVKMRLKADNGQYNEKEFIIETIKLTNLSSTGSFNEGISSESGATKTTYHNADMAWTTTAFDTDYVFINGGNEGIGVPLPMTKEEVNGITKNGNVYTITADADINKLDISKTTDINDLSHGTNLKGYYGLLIPQKIKRAVADEKKTKLEIRWRHYYIDAATGAQKSVDKTSIMNLEEYTELWEPGKRYIYTIIFKGDIIEFAPTVTDWKDAGSKPEDGSHNGDIQI